MLVRVLVAAGACLLFWLICYSQTGTDKKNMTGFRSYPEAVRRLVRADEKLGRLAPAEASVPKILLSNILLFSVIFILIGIAMKYTAGFDGFADSFIYFLILGEVINLFDLVVIDMLWWRNSRRIRFSCAPEKKLYQNPKTHIDSFLRGIPTFVVPALITAGVLSILP